MSNIRKDVAGQQRFLFKTTWHIIFTWKEEKKIEPFIFKKLNVRMHSSPNNTLLEQTQMHMI